MVCKMRSMKYMMNHKKSLLMSVITIIYANAGIFGCGMSSQSIETKNQQLQSAQQRLLKNPLDKQALSVMVKMLKDRDGVARYNAAQTLGGLAEEIGASIKDEAVPGLIDLLDDGDRYDKKSGCLCAKTVWAARSSCNSYLKEESRAKRQ